MATNNKTSLLISQQLPFFVRNDHERFVQFLEAYYRFLEEEGQVTEEYKNLLGQIDVDRSEEKYLEHLYSTFLKLIPQEVITDKNLLLKHVKDFYRARGTEKSVDFLLRILFGGNEAVSFYYPKVDILRASDGKWFIEKSIKIREILVDGTPNDDIVYLQKVFKNKEIRGVTSSATAYVERLFVYYEKGVRVYELKLSNQSKDFTNGETFTFTYTDEDTGEELEISGTIISGSINSVQIVNPGTGYEVGQRIVIENDPLDTTGAGANIEISQVSQGEILSVYAIYGGAGYQVNNRVLFSGGGGTGANAYISVVRDDSYFHPNSYNIYSSTISLEANTPIGNSLYSNLNIAISDPANNWIQNSLSHFVYSNTGPILLLAVSSGGNNYTSKPTLSVASNTMVRELGILGRMDIVSGGTNYEIGDTIVFENVSGGYGTGAAANVRNVDANGTITEVQFIPFGGFPIGGLGYNQNYLPRANVISANGVGANIVVTSILAAGANLDSTSEAIGKIEALRIVDGGTGYTRTPTMNLQSFGDGNAEVTATILTGVYSYPGRYLNDDGHISGYNFLQDRDYYQLFSYVIKTTKPLVEYRYYMKNLNHPAGTKMFGEYLFVETTDSPTYNAAAGTQNVTIYAANTI